MVRNVDAVQLHRVVFLVGPVGVASVTGRLRDGAVALDHVQMTFRTRHFPGEVFAMVEVEALISDDFRRRAVAEEAIGGPLPHLHAFEVAREAYRFRNLDVGPHDDLGMARRTTQLFTPRHLAQVKGVVEGDTFFEGYPSR
jgi:hypothetical protein